MKAWVAFILFFGGLAGLFFYQIHYFGQRWEHLNSEGMRTSGTVLNIYKGIEFTYDAYNRKYQNTTSTNPRNIINGERYLVLYDKNDPSNSVIDFSVPVFDTLNFFKLCIDSFERINGKEEGLIRFEYEIASKRISRYHEIKFKELPLSGPYQIWVNKDDIRISYLVGTSCK